MLARGKCFIVIMLMFMVSRAHSFETNGSQTTTETVAKCKSSLVEQIKDSAGSVFGEITVSDLIGSYVDTNTSHIELWIYNDTLNVKVGYDFDNATCLIKEKPSLPVGPQTEVLAIGDFIRNADGTIMTSIKSVEAVDRCLKMGSRLPTIRELVKDAEKYGGKLIEVKEYNAGKFPKGYVRSDFEIFKSENTEGKKDIFYYSSIKYKKPLGDLGKYRIYAWSSDPQNDLQTVFVTFMGEIRFASEGYRFEDQAARCVVK